MNILYCGDDKIFDGLIISILSLLKHNKEILNIYIFTAKITYKNKIYNPINLKKIEILNQIVKNTNSKSCVTRIDLTYIFKHEQPTINMRSYFTPNCMLRLYADEISQIPGKILYLDADVLCNRNFSEYYHQNMENHEIVGTLDHYGKWWFHQDLRSFDYLNSGVLLLNMDLIRKTRLFAKCRQMCRTRLMFMPDQSAINKLCHTKKIVGNEYNEQHRQNNKTVFRHYSTSIHIWPVFYTLKVKPWQIDRMHTKLSDHNYDDILENYLKIKKNIVNKLS